MDDQILRNKSVVRDFSTTTLAAIPNLFGRLVYIASLRDLSSGNYEHSGLAALYSPQAIQESLECCHYEVFQKILETPLSIQLEDLRECLAGMSGSFGSTVSHWRQMEAYRILPPGNAPDYLRELFFSNLRALLEILQAENSTVRSSG
ncbi:MAG TPA: hypothetical protein VIW23_06040 [Candidatus Acidoferrum sp.]|jgi:hypothetical protein